MSGPLLFCFVGTLISQFKDNKVRKESEKNYAFWGWKNGSSAAAWHCTLRVRVTGVIQMVPSSETREF